MRHSKAIWLSVMLTMWLAGCHDVDRSDMPHVKMNIGHVKDVVGGKKASSTLNTKGSDANKEGRIQNSWLLKTCLWLLKDY
ncbi:hypothetical protein [Vibrio mediterranei]|uniref:hypothetical protein n=1 Tax=Vibrio mediterranei TaxID=689 RepID=UPI001EFDD5A1|nr:hypothetical protein [Vibrio mediterranei]MCG9660340.1 hypothetical protein [Vibrio mediterranei]